jgi:hypothetical protein
MEKNKTQLSLIERTVRQAELVEQLGRELKKNGGDVAKAQQLEIEMERLAFYQTAAKGNPRGRAANVIDIARSTVLGRAVTQPLPKVGV